MVAVVFNTGDESYFDSSYGFLFRRQSTKTMTVTDSGGRTETYGTFTVGETVNVENKDMHDNVVTTFSAKFEGTFVRSGTEPIADRTYLVVSYVDASYGTRYVLIGPHTTDTLESEFDMASDITVENYFIPCFLPGTLVATPTGERKIEELVADDLVLATGGGGGGAPRTREMDRPPRRLDPLRSCGGSHARAFLCWFARRRPAA